MIISVSISILLALLAQSTPPDTPVIVVFETDAGAITVEVDTRRAPITAANFLRYVDAGMYDGGRFHRTVRPDTELRSDYPIQVVQAGPREADGAPPEFPPIPLERTTLTGIKHTDGTVSMARSAADSATSDFFVCIGDQPELDFGGGRNADGQGFAAFARVVSGMDVVRRIQGSPVAPAVGEGGSAPLRPLSQLLAPPIRILKAVRK
jgi:peptidyl-prolyl cis-trans isomerase A (cyclophilin A)